MTLPSANRTHELSVQRRLTEWFIAWNPSSIALIPQARVRTATGASTWEDQTPRPTQDFRLIPASDAQRPTPTPDGVERRIDFTLLGRWDAVVEPYDYWIDAEGRRIEVVAMVPYNGYEVKALVTRHG